MAYSMRNQPEMGMICFDDRASQCKKIAYDRLDCAYILVGDRDVRCGERPLLTFVVSTLGSLVKAPTSDSS